MLNRWHRLSLQVKMTLIIICIVGVSAVTTEWLEARSIQHDGGRQCPRRGAGRRASRRPERDQSCPAVESGGADQRAGEDPGDSAGSTQHRAVRVSSQNRKRVPSRLRAPAPRRLHSIKKGRLPLFSGCARNGEPLIDYADRTNTHRVFLAAPIFLRDAVVGATYAEFSTLQMDEALESLRQASRTRRLLTGLAIVVAINLFLYFKVHRRVKRLAHRRRIGFPGNHDLGRTC